MRVRIPLMALTESSLIVARKHVYVPEGNTGSGLIKHTKRNRTKRCHLAVAVPCPKATYCGALHKSEHCLSYVITSDVNNKAGCRGCHRYQTPKCKFQCRRNPAHFVELY